MNILLLVLLLISAVASSSSAEERKLNRPEAPRLFDFQHFKEVFDKSYRSLGEELAREKIFLSKALKVFKSWISFNHARRSYFLKLNERSDWTQEELDDILTKQTLSSKLLGLPKVTDEQISELINTNNLFPEFAKTKEPAEQEAEVEFEADGEPSNKQSYFNEAWHWLQAAVRGFNPDQKQPPENPNGPDIVYVDHRSTECFRRAKNQGRCGACYLFSTTALYEWHFCMESGNKGCFSEQYALDCGERANLSGCAGGNEPLVAGFAAELGFELNHLYPYLAESRLCPYPEDYPQEQLGYLRLNSKLGGMSIVKYELINKVLQVVPLALGVGVPDDFESYAGGIYDGSDCKKGPWHSMVIVGRGREGGRNYWILRNSYGPHFGIESGYFKMDFTKRDCFADNAIAFALLPGKGEGNFLFGQTGNDKYNKSYVEKRLDDLINRRPIPPNPYTSHLVAPLEAVTPSSR